MQDLNEPLRDSSHQKDLQERVLGDLQTLNTGRTRMGRKPTVDPSLKKVPWCLRDCEDGIRTALYHTYSCSARSPHLASQYLLANAQPLLEEGKVLIKISFEMGDGNF